MARGDKVTSQFLDRMQQYLSIDDGDIWVRRMRFLYCPEKELIEQDISEFIELFLPARTNSIDQLLDSLSGGGIIPAAIKARTKEISDEADRLRLIILRLATPIIEVV